MRFIPFHRPYVTGALPRLAVAAAAFGFLLPCSAPLEGTRASAAEGPAQEDRQGSQTAAPTEEPVASLEVTLKRYQDLSRVHRAAILASGYSDVRPVSTALEEAVRVAFEVAGSFEGARQLLSNEVVWNEAPTKFDWRAKEGPGYVSGLSDETFGEAALEEPARIFYARYPAQGDVEAVVLMNSLVTREIGTQYLWLQTSPYALVRFGNAVRFSPFGDKMYDSPSCHIVPMGVVLNGASAPTALFLYRYSTRAGKVEIVMHALTPATSEWAEETLEWTSVTNFAYDAAIQQLTLWKWKGDRKEVVVSEIVNVAEQIEKWGPQRTWKLDAPKPDAISASPASNKVAAKAPTADGTPEAMRQAIANYEAAVREAREHFKDGGQGYPWTAKTDLALKEVVRVAFGQFGELEAVKAALGDRVRWQPVPRWVRGYDLAMLAGPMPGTLPESALDEPPIINFMTYQSKEQDAVVVVMLNTFATWDQPFVVPLDTYPYAAGRVNGRPFFSSDIAGISRITPEPSRSQTYQLAGFVEAPGSLPAAVYFTQAWGATFCACVLNPADMTWTRGCYDEGWDSEFWGYDCESHLLGFGEEKFDVGQWVREWVLKTGAESSNTPAIPQSAQPEGSVTKGPLSDESSSVEKPTGDASALSTAVDGGSDQTASAEFVPVRPMSSTSSDSSYQSALLEYHQIAASYTRRLQTSPDTSVQVLELDSALKTLVRAAFEELRSLKAVQENLKVTIEWVSMPANPHELDQLPETQRPYRLDSGHLSEAAITEPPYVYFCSLQDPAGLDIAVMLNSLVVRNSFVGLEGLQTEPYAVVLDGERMTYSSNITGTSPYGWLSGLPHVTQVLDITVRPRNRPAALLAVRSYVSGCPLSVYSCDYDPASGMWQSTVEELNYVDDWSYNDQTGQLAVTVLTGEKAVHNYPDFVGME